MIALDDLAISCGSTLAVGGYDLLAQPHDGAAFRAIAAATDAPLWAALALNLTAPAVSGRAVRDLLSPTNGRDAPLLRLLVSAIREDSGEDLLIQAASHACVATLDALRSDDDGLAAKTSLTLQRGNPLRAVLTALDADAVAHGGAAVRLAAPAYRMMLGLLAAEYSLPSGTPWNSSSIPSDDPRTVDATRPLRLLLESLIQRNHSVDTGDGARHHQASLALQALLLDPDLHAMQKGERACDEATYQALRQEALIVFQAHRFLDPATPDKYTHELLRGFMWAGEGAILRPRDHAIVDHFSPAATVLDEDDLLPDDGDLWATRDAVDEGTAHAEVSDWGDEDESQDMDRRDGPPERVPVSYQRARQMMLAYPHPARSGVIQRNDLARILVALGQGDDGDVTPRQAGLLLLFLLCLHTGLPPARLAAARRGSTVAVMAAERPDGLIVLDPAAGLLIYRSPSDAELWPATPLPPGLYIPTDGVRRIPLPPDLADLAQAYDAAVRGRDDAAFFIDAPDTTLELLRAFMTKATASSPRPAFVRQLPATFWAYHVRDAEGLDTVIAALISDRALLSLRLPRFYSTVAVKTVGQALHAVVGNVRADIDRTVHGLGLRPPDVRVIAQSVAPAPRQPRPVVRHAHLPALGSPFCPRAEVVHSLFMHLRQRIAAGLRADPDDYLTTERGHNLVTVYLLLGFTLFAALRPLEVDDVLTDLCAIDADATPWGFPCVLLEAKGNVHGEEDRLIPLGAYACRLVAQARQLPRPRDLRSCPPPLRGRLFYLAGPAGLRPADEAGLRRVLHEELQDRQLRALALRLYDWRHAARSHVLERTPLEGLRGCRRLDALLGHRQPDDWREALTWPDSFGRDLWPPARLADEEHQLAHTYGYEILTLPSPPREGDVPTDEEAARQRLASDRADLVAWMRVTRDRVRWGAVDSERERERLALQLVAAGKALPLPYLTPRGLRALAAATVARCRLAEATRSAAERILAAALLRACGLTAHGRNTMGTPPGRLDLVHLADLRQAPLWAYRPLCRALTTGFPHSALGDGVDDADLLVVLLLLLVLEEGVVVSGNWSTLLAPQTRLIVHNGRVWIDPGGRGPAIPPWPLRPDSRAALLTVGLAYRLKRRDDVQRPSDPTAPWVITLQDVAPAALLHRRLRDVWERLWGTVALPPPPLSLPLAWGRLAALRGTAPLTIAAAAGHDLYAGSEPPSPTVLDAYRAAYGSSRSAITKRSDGGAPLQTGAIPSAPPRPPAPSRKQPRDEQALLVRLRRRLTLLRNATLTVAAFAAQCRDDIAQVLEVPDVDRSDWRERAVTEAQLWGMEASKMSNAALVTLWTIDASERLRQRQRQWTVTTLADYGLTLVRFVRSLGDLPLVLVNTDDVADFLAQHVSRGAFGRARSAVLHLLDDVPLPYYTGVDRGDPSLHRRQRRTTMPLLLPDVMERFLGEMDRGDESNEDGARRATIALLGHMSLRVGETYRLTIADVEIGSGLGKTGDACVLIRRSKRGTTRQVPLAMFPPPWQARVIRYVARRKAEIPADMHRTTPLVVRQDGRPFHRAADVAAEVVPILRRLSGLPVTYHTLRGSAANLLLAAGHDVRAIAVLLGHGTVLSTLYYLHVLDPDHPPPRPLAWPAAVVTLSDIARIGGLTPQATRAWTKRATFPLSTKIHSEGAHRHRGRRRGRPEQVCDVDRARAELARLLDRGRSASGVAAPDG